MEATRPMKGARPGVISDWAGVLTSPLIDAIGAWLDDERIDTEHYRRVMRPYFDGSLADKNPVHALERGELETAEFERDLAELLRLTDGHPVPAEGLIRRMFSRFDPVHEMYDVLRGVRADGAATALLSNSWGNGYPREHFASTFDTVVISGEVGMRKPEERIYLHTCEQLDLSPEDCVFIDDLESNVRIAEDLGMTGILHTDVTTTRRELARFLAPEDDGAPGVPSLAIS